MKFHKISNNFDIYLFEGNVLENQKVEIINNKSYHRFMDYIYIPDQVYNLNSDYVKELNNLRDKYSNVLIDYSYNEIVYSQIIEAAKVHITTKEFINILDFGCGNGGAFNTIQKNFPTADIYGYDLRNIINETHYKEIYQVTTNNNFPHKENYFSAVFAFFVFQFNITDQQIAELRRILTPEGILAFNLINSSDFNILKRLQKAGFSILKNFHIDTQNNNGNGFIYFATKNK